MLSTRSPTFKHDTVNSFEGSPLGDIAIASLSGPDAEAFAQSQFMNDVQALAVGHWQWNGWLTSKGRVIAVFALLRLAPGELRLVVPDVPLAGLCDELRRFVFRSKLRIECRDELAAFADWTGRDDGGPRRDRLLARPGGAIGLDLAAEGGHRLLWIAPRRPAPEDPDATARWRREDLRHGLPRWPVGLEQGWTPHMLSLDALNAFSTRKGCYPGQEIVARTHFIGQSKRRAWWVEGEGLTPGMALLDDEGRAIGEIVEADREGRGALAVAALPGPATCRAGSGMVQVSPPLTGLARPY